jgi:uncharacterized protein
LPRSSPADAGTLLVAAVSGRALAAAARRAGYVPLVADFFADTDTKLIAQDCRRLDDLRRGFRWRTIAPVLDVLAQNAPTPPVGVVYGAGFEDRPALLAKIGEHWPLLGNDASAVARVKAPDMFFAELARLGVPHPRTVTALSKAGEGWLAKRRGGAGGSHVATTEVAATKPGTGKMAGAHLYFQERVEGRPISALFVGDGTSACVLGFSEQWAAPTHRAKWRYGGAARPAELKPGLEARLTNVVERVVPCFQLRGLGSADFLVNDEPWLLEINPRPGATLDIFDSEAEPLLRLHLEAVLDNRLPTAPLVLPSATAAAIVHATEPITVPKTVAWPEWTADRPSGGERIDKDRPICTVLARAETGPEAQQLAIDRVSTILTAWGG